MKEKTIAIRENDALEAVKGEETLLKTQSGHWSTGLRQLSKIKGRQELRIQRK